MIECLATRPIELGDTFSPNYEFRQLALGLRVRVFPLGSPLLLGRLAGRVFHSHGRPEGHDPFSL